MGRNKPESAVLFLQLAKGMSRDDALREVKNKIMKENVK